MVLVENFDYIQNQLLIKKPLIAQYFSEVDCKEAFKKINIKHLVFNLKDTPYANYENLLQGFKDHLNINKIKKLNFDQEIEDILSDQEKTANLMRKLNLNLGTEKDVIITKFKKYKITLEKLKYFTLA